jgi:hypothetical protein
MQLWMQLSGAKLIEISMVAAGALGLLLLLAPGFGQKSKQTAEGWQFPVKWTCLLLYWLGFSAGIGSVVFAGHRLLLLGAANWVGWAGFAFGFALVLFVLSGWPEPLIFDQEGLLERGSPLSRIRWEDLSHIREYQVRYDRGVVIHSIYGKQLVLPDMTYGSEQILNSLLELHPIPFHSSEDESAPISILKAHTH